MKSLSGKSCLIIVVLFFFLTTESKDCIALHQPSRIYVSAYPPSNRSETLPYCYPYYQRISVHPELLILWRIEK